MLQAEPPVMVIGSARGAGKVLERREVFGEVQRHNKEICVELVENGLALLKCDEKYGVANGSQIILPINFESITVVENGWSVACKYGIYDIYDSAGRPYKGLSFLKKSNAIKFARTLA